MVHHQLKFLKQVVVNWSHFQTMTDVFILSKTWRGVSR